MPAGRAHARRAAGRTRALCCPRAPDRTTYPGAGCAKELEHERRGPGRSPHAGSARGTLPSPVQQQRLSATDISALASMKNVAKCDTWCELQNPVNHRVFERKLRPKAFGRRARLPGCHATCRPQPPDASKSCHGRAAAGGCGSWPPVASLPWLAQKRAMERRTPRRAVVVKAPLGQRSGPSLPWCSAAFHPKSMRPQVRRGHPLSLSISISGGKETNKDSPSNGERTGKCPP